MSDEFCKDCPDHEACCTGWPCTVVKAVDEDHKRKNELLDWMKARLK
jgi:hypothetical protein